MVTGLMWTRLIDGRTTDALLCSQHRLPSIYLPSTLLTREVVRVLGIVDES